MQDTLQATQVRKDFSRFVDAVIHDKPQAVKRNHDVFWSLSQTMMTEVFSGYTFALEYEQEGDGSLVGSLLPIQDIVVYGKSVNDLLDDAATQLVEYAQDYYAHFDKYYHAPNRKSHLPYVLNVLSQQDSDGVRKLIHA
ncbi:MAG: hypothetical protein ABF629_13710 [Sporolactobacillus sp.]